MQAGFAVLWTQNWHPKTFSIQSDWAGAIDISFSFFMLKAGRGKPKGTAKVFIQSIDSGVWELES